jgi:Flp pilus assembly protein TadD/TolB-like protein
VTSALEVVQAALADRYVVLREVGSGGMATVYLAEDLRHHRQVAVKVLRPELAAHAGTERFLREITVAASLSHPNILPVHDSGEAGGLLFFVMPLVEGESLRDRLLRERQLAIPDALRIVKEVAAGLSYAHSRGVVHRDIKPENVLFFGGQAVVADFGIARAALGGESTPLTSTGMVVGTAAYMSPEQATGERDIDARSDVYSLGCLLYEMLAGEPPFTGASVQAITARKLTDAVPRLATVRETVGPGLEGAIGQALAKSPADRFSSVAAFVEALERSGTEPAAKRRWRPAPRAMRRTALVGSGLIALVAAAWAMRQSIRNRPPRFDRVAMLPLRTGGPDSIPGYLVDGLTDGLIGDLARLDRLDVIALASVSQDSGKPIVQVVKDLGVSAIIEGTLQRSPRRLALEIRLSVPGQQSPQWTRSFETGPSQASTLQHDVIRALAGYLGARSTRSGGERAPANPAVHDLYLRGRYHLSGRSPEGFQNAVDYFRQALAADPAHAPSYAGLAQYYSLLPFYTNAAPSETFDRAMAAAQKAVELDPTLPEAHAALGYLKAYRDWDWDGAKLEYARALALRPSDAEVHHALSRLLAARGEIAEAVREADRSHQLDPLSLVAHANIGVIRYFGRDFAEAERRVKATLELDPEFPVAHWGLGLVQEQLGHFREAEVEFEKGIAIAGRGSNMLASLGHLYGVTKRSAEAGKLLAELRERARTKPILDYQIALVQTGLGQSDDALASLERAYQRRSTLLSYIGMDPRLDPLRSTPRFAALLQRMNLVSRR